ncbi:MAG: hypothetical protein V4489_01045, partial [Chlamydiota bacterium]
MKLRYKILIGSVSFFAINLICKGLNGNFDVDDLIKPSKSGSAWDTSSEKGFDINSLLKQKFHYLGKGHQAFAFTSEDGQYVLKLFKPHYPHIEFFGESFNFTYIPFSKWLYKSVAKEAFDKRLAADFTSYVNAYNSFKEESLVEYLHLSKTSDLKHPLQLFDKINILRNFDPNDTCFLIQKKVEPLQVTLKNLLKEDKIMDVRLVLEKLLNLLNRRVELGFYKPTHKFHANFGCVGLEPIQLDIGNLLTLKDLGLAEGTPTIDLATSVKKLKMWLG